jgi:mRNA-degrading endonuclease RelE of RelBE toxin-antitoxin system
MPLHSSSGTDRLCVALTERFETDLRLLDSARRSATLDAVSALSTALGTSALYRPLGLRRIHRSGIWVTSVALGLRLLFALEGETVTLLRVATRERIRRYLRWA